MCRILEDMRNESRNEGYRLGIEEGIEKGMEKGRKEGQKEKAVKVAEYLIREKIPTDIICKSTDLSIEEIHKLEVAIAQELS